MEDDNGPAIACVYAIRGLLTINRSRLAAYREQTGDMGEPLVVGSGTYARAMKNIVAFGPGRPFWTYAVSGE